MKEKFLSTQNGHDYYVFEEIVYNNKKYCLVADCNIEKDEIDTDQLYEFELVENNGDYSFKEIEDEELAIKVAEIFRNKTISFDDK